MSLKKNCKSLADKGAWRMWCIYGLRNSFEYEITSYWYIILVHQCLYGPTSSVEWTGSPNMEIIFYIYRYSLRFFIPLENFSLIWRHHHYQWKVANLYLYSALIAIESRLRVLWRVTPAVTRDNHVYDNLQRPVTLNPSCWLFGSGVVTTLRYILLQPGFEPWSPAC